MSVFYDHLLGLGSVRVELEEHLTPAEAEEIIIILDAALHHTVMETILSLVPEHAHEAFMQQFATNPASPEHITFLRHYNADAEELISQAAEKESRRFLDTIHR